MIIKCIILKGGDLIWPVSLISTYLSPKWKNCNCTSFNSSIVGPLRRWPLGMSWGGNLTLQSLNPMKLSPGFVTKLSPCILFRGPRQVIWWSWCMFKSINLWGYTFLVVGGWMKMPYMHLILVKSHLIFFSLWNRNFLRLLSILLN